MRGGCGSGRAGPRTIQKQDGGPRRQAAGPKSIRSDYKTRL